MKEYIVPYIKSAIALIIIIIIILIGVHLLKNGYEKEKIETIKTDMLSISAKIKMLQEQKIMKEKDAKYIGTKATDMEEDEEVKKLIDNKTIDLKAKKHTYYVINKDQLQELELPEVELETGYYIVDYETAEVIYTNGVTDNNGNVWYTLSDIENIGKELVLDKTEIKEDQEEKEDVKEEVKNEKEEE